MTLSIESSDFGVTRDGQSIDRYRLSNSHGVEASVITFGGIVTSLLVPGAGSDQVDIVLGYDTLAQYEECQIYMGCIAGRYANRIANASFELDGYRYRLDANNNGHHLHGGEEGFHKVVWAARVETPDIDSSAASPLPPRLVLEHVSNDNHGGYPGNLTVRVIYSLDDDNRLMINYEATTDKATVVNLTSHSYFNLGGHQEAGLHGVLDHEVEIASFEFIPTTEQGIPLGKSRPVSGTSMDFNLPGSVREKLFSDDAQLTAGSGFDHTWVLRGEKSSIGEQLNFAARLTHQQSGRQLEIHTTQPGIQFYTANHVHQCEGKEGVIYDQYGSLCLETQHYPDSPNHKDFPTTALWPGEVLQESTVYQLLF